MRDVLKTFAETTTAHGVGRAVTERAIWLRVLWGVIFLTTLGVCIAQIYFLVVTYQQHPVTIERTVSRHLPTAPGHHRANGKSSPTNSTRSPSSER